MSTISNHALTWTATRVNTVVLVFTLISGLVVFLRLFTRFVLSKAAGLEDACIAIAMILSGALAVTVAQQAMHGMGRHYSALDSEQRYVLLKNFWAGLWIYNLALTITKVAILIQYLRIFPIRRFRMACYGVLAVVIATGGWAVASSIFICSPVSFAWDKNNPDGRCMNQFVIWFLNAALNIAQDIFILFMPLPVIKTLNIPKGQKKGLITMFGLGASVTLVSVIRLSSLQSVSNSTDVSWDNPANTSLSAVEVNVGIICACLPAMRPLLALMMPKYFDGSQEFKPATRADIEQQKRSHSRKQSTSTNAHTTRTNTPLSTTPRTMTPQSGANTPLQTLRPVLSRTASGKFVLPSLDNNSRVHFSPAHSRSSSKNSAALRPAPLKISPQETKPHRFQGPINPLGMSPVTPFSPPRMQEIYQNGGNASKTSLARSNTEKKPLPITPFPVS